MVSYLSIGTLIFADWEQWDWMTASYFSFITLTSVGFGDYVPLKSFADFDGFYGQVKVAITSCYCIAGERHFL